MMPVQAAGKRTEPPVSVPNALQVLGSVKAAAGDAQGHTRRIDREPQLQHYHQNFHLLIEALHLFCRGCILGHGLNWWRMFFDYCQWKTA